ADLRKRLGPQLAEEVRARHRAEAAKNLRAAQTRIPFLEEEVKTLTQEVENLKDRLAKQTPANLEQTDQHVKSETERLKALATQSDVVPRPQRGFPTGAGQISSAAFSPDGKQLFVADWNGAVYAYDFATGKTRFTITGKNGEDRFLAVSPDGQFLVGV